MSTAYVIVRYNNEIKGCARFDFVWSLDNAVHALTAANVLASHSHNM